MPTRDLALHGAAKNTVYTSDVESRDAQTRASRPRNAKAMSDDKKAAIVRGFLLQAPPGSLLKVANGASNLRRVVTTRRCI
jgi:hypothetical protein